MKNQEDMRKLLSVSIRSVIRVWPEVCSYSSRKHAYIILTPLNPTFI